jgi:hypothetical protein
MVIVLGHEDDPLASGVYRQLCRRSASVAFVGASDLFPGIALNWSLAEPPEQSFLTLSSSRMPLPAITGVLARLRGPVHVNTSGAGEPPEAEEEQAYVRLEVWTALLAFLHSLHCPVINRPRPGRMYPRSWGSMIHARLMAECGFLPPDMLLTSHPDEAAQAYRRFGESVLVGPGAGEIGCRWVRGLEGAALVREMAARSPICLRQAPEGEWLEVFVVGDQVFGGVTSPARAADEAGAAPARAVELPAALQDQCARLARTLGAELLQLHLVQTHEDELYCVDFNGWPGEAACRGPFGERLMTALADRLAGEKREADGSGLGPDGGCRDRVRLHAAAGAGG